MRGYSLLGRRLGATFFSVFGLFAAVCIRGKVFFRLPKRKRPPRHMSGYSPLGRRLGMTFCGIWAHRRGLHPWEGVFSSAKKKKAATAHARVFAAQPPSWSDVLRLPGPFKRGRPFPRPSGRLWGNSSFFAERGALSGGFLFFFAYFIGGGLYFPGKHYKVGVEERCLRRKGGRRMEENRKTAQDWIRNPEDSSPEETMQEPVAIGEHAWEQEKNNGTDVLREPDHLGDGEASDIGGICDLVLRGIGIGMGVAVTVLGTLNAIQSSTAFIMLGVGLTAVSISVMKKM